MRIDLPDILKNKVVTIVGGGPSLKGFDFSRVSGYVIAVNNSAFFVKSDMLVALDMNWQMVHSLFLESYEGILVSDRKAAFPAKIIQYTAMAAGSLDWTMKKVNLSGFVALSVALHLGAAKVVLLGFDGGYSGQASRYYKGDRPVNDHNYSSRNELWNIFKDRNIVNVGMESKIESFRKVPLEGNFYES